MNIFKQILFSSANSLVRLAQTRHITEEDTLPLPDHLHPRNVPVETSLGFRWTSPRALLFSLIWSLRQDMIVAYIWNLAQILATLLSPFFVHQFISEVSKGVTSDNLLLTLTYGFLLGLCGFVAGLCMQHYFFKCLGAYQISVNILNKRIFQHSLRLSLEARQKNQIGDIVNHMSSDSESVCDFPLILGDLINALILMVGVIIMLFYYIGWAALAALIVLFTLAPLTRFVARNFTHLDEQMMHERDRRVTLMTQALNAIRVVKFFAWEKSVEKEVQTVRDQELLNRKRMAQAEALAGLAYMGVSSLVLFVALATYSLLGHNLTAATIFTCISLFTTLEGPFGSLSGLLARSTNATVGAGRILKFLGQEEVAEQSSEDSSVEPVGLEIQNLNLSYPSSQQETLKNIDLQVPAGASLAIVGPVGSGKSSLLLSILGETAIKGRVQFQTKSGLRPRLAYVPQEAYIINGSVLENLTFGEDINKEDLRKALHTSCLSKDLKQWPGGLRTEIGEKGVNLSGGQKQRLSLARSYLRKGEVVLLDDPLSAVDTETETLLCERLLFGAWKNKTRIVVTHRLEHLDQFDQVAYIEEGFLRGVGRFSELLKNCQPFAEFYSEHRKTQGEEATHSQGSSNLETETETALTSEEVRVTKDEDREVGAVKSTVYWDYIKSLGGDDSKSRPWILGLLALCAIAGALLPLLQKAWLSYYSDHQELWPALPAIGIYGVIGILVLVATLVNNLYWLYRGIKAGQSIHNRMLKSVLNSPVRFFDSTPVGRVLQRFSRDLESVDIYLQWSFNAAINCALQILISLILIVTLMPKMIFAIVPAMYAYYRLQRNYRSPAREVKRFDSVARSPRYAHFKESLQGLLVIRGFNKSSWFMDQFYQKLAHSQRMFYSHYLMNRWFSSRIPLVGGLISIATVTGITLSSYSGAMEAGVAGLVTIYSLSFWGSLNFGIRIFADIESRMTSIERLKFMANLEGEKSILKQNAEPLPATWPEKGHIDIKNLKIRYAPHLPQVLKGVSFSVSGGQRVGIIGRTGSGKSTFFQSLFRFIEAEEGSIAIDGVDIASVPLNRLRRSLAIIPQDPTLFMGTIRDNLDRFQEYKDEEIVLALQQASMWDHVRKLPMGLQSQVTEGGLNLSQGQRQLLCLSRALLTKARVIVMDEATASVDVQTDTLLQRVIRESFRNVTMLIIAHRLGTVSDCDLLVELADGEVRSIRRPVEIKPEELSEKIYT